MLGCARFMRAAPRGVARSMRPPSSSSSFSSSSSGGFNSRNLEFRTLDLFDLQTPEAPSSFSAAASVAGGATTAEQRQQQQIDDWVAANPSESSFASFDDFDSSRGSSSFAAPASFSESTPSSSQRSTSYAKMASETVAEQRLRLLSNLFAPVGLQVPSDELPDAVTAAMGFDPARAAASASSPSPSSSLTPSSSSSSSAEELRRDAYFAYHWQRLDDPATDERAARDAHRCLQAFLIRHRPKLAAALACYRRLRARFPTTTSVDFRLLLVAFQVRAHRISSSI